MYDHHRTALETTVEAVREDDDFLACILTGSIPRGRERPDSDVDLVLVATDEAYERRRADWDLQYYRDDVCDHPDVYVDGKVVTRAFLEAVADHGSEPARSAYVDADLRYTEEPAIESLLGAIPVYPSDARTDRIETFYSQMQAYRWYVDEAETRGDAYLAHHTAAQLSLFGGRLLLANAEVLFPYHKWFTRVLEDLNRKPPETVALLETLLAERTSEAADAFADAIESYRDWETPEAGWPVRFMLDREWQWRDGQPALEEL